MEPIQITFDLTQDELTRAVEAYCVVFMYQGEDTPQAKAEFFKQKCIDWITQNVNSYEMQQASQAAITIAQNNTDEIVIT